MNVSLVDTSAALADLCKRIEAAPRVALDTEFHTERSYTAHLMVVQVALPSSEGDVEEVAIVDPLALRDLQPLAEALATTTVVGHALSSDLKILSDTFGSLPAAVFDTQVAAAFCGYGLSISLLDLVRDLASVSLRKSQTVSDWSARPFSEKQMEYLVDDVRYLFALQDRLEKELAERGRLEWAAEESLTLLQPAKYRTDTTRLYTRIPGSARLNRRELGILRELALLRDEAARQRNVPLKYILPDDAMVGIVQVRPRSIEELVQLRRIDAGARKHHGAAIIAAVARGEAIAEDDLPLRPSRPLSPQRDALVSTMNVLVNALAAQNDLPSTLLVARGALERVARDAPTDYEGFVAALDLAPWRRELVAPPLWRFVSGSDALRIVGYDQGVPRIVVGES